MRYSCRIRCADKTKTRPRSGETRIIRTHIQFTGYSTERQASTLLIPKPGTISTHLLPRNTFPGRESERKIVPVLYKVVLPSSKYQSDSRIGSGISLIYSALVILSAVHARYLLTSGMRDREQAVCRTSAFLVTAAAFSVMS